MVRVKFNHQSQGYVKAKMSGLRLALGLRFGLDRGFGRGSGPVVVVGFLIFPIMSSSDGKGLSLPVTPNPNPKP